MRTYGVVKALNVGKYIILSRGAGRIVRQVDQLTLEAGEEIFGHGIVVRIAPAGHALSDAIGVQALTVGPGGVLDAAVAVKDQALGRSAAAAGHVQRGQGQLGVDSVRECVAHDFPGA